MSNVTIIVAAAALDISASRPLTAPAPGGTAARDKPVSPRCAPIAKKCRAQSSRYLAAKLSLAHIK